MELSEPRPVTAAASDNLNDSLEGRQVELTVSWLNNTTVSWLQGKETRNLTCYCVTARAESKTTMMRTFCGALLAVACACGGASATQLRASIQEALAGTSMALEDTTEAISNGALLETSSGLQAHAIDLAVPAALAAALAAARAAFAAGKAAAEAALVAKVAALVAKVCQKGAELSPSMAG